LPLIAASLRIIEGAAVRDPFVHPGTLPPNSRLLPLTDNRPATDRPTRRYGVSGMSCGALCRATSCQRFGARFSARIDRTANGLRASYVLIDGNGLLADTDARMFGSDRDARDWLYEEARRHGFQSISVEFGDDLE
jgi:hypothetical protein